MTLAELVSEHILIVKVRERVKVVVEVRFNCICYLGAARSLESVGLETVSETVVGSSKIQDRGHARPNQVVGPS